jgi:FAD/FMN-containing dehydrogenase
MDAACKAVTAIVASGVVPAALEILDRLTIEAVEASVFAAGYPQDAEAVLLVELDGTRGAVEADTAEVEQLLRAHAPIDIESTDDPSQRARLWKGRKGAFGAMGRLDNDLYVLDGVVPRSRLQPVLAGTIEIAQRYSVKLSNVFHAGDGNLHPNLSFDSRDAEQRERVIAAGAEILRLCVDEGGSITGEHGVGNEKMDYMRYMFSDTDLEVFRDVKACFDPAGLGNPGKIYPTGGSCAEGHSATTPGALDA